MVNVLLRLRAHNRWSAIEEPILMAQRQLLSGSQSWRINYLAETAPRSGHRATYLNGGFRRKKAAR